MKKAAKKVFSVRLDSELVKALQTYGFTLTEAIETALRSWLERRKDEKK